MIRLLLMGVVLLAGCTINRFPDTCDITQKDPHGQGYTVGKFPCKLTHYSGVKEDGK